VKWLYLIAISLLGGCSYGDYQINKKVVIANEVRQRAAIQLYREKGLRLCGTGGQMMDQIKMLALSFDYNHEIGIEEGRDLLITAMRNFLAIVNEDKTIRPYLTSYPFQPKNIEIRIFIKNPDQSDPEPGKLCVVSALEGVLKYSTTDPSLPLFKTVHKETYEEALLVMQRSSQIPTPVTQATGAL
jgi:hypothetical protein